MAIETSGLRLNNGCGSGSRRSLSSVQEFDRGGGRIASQLHPQEEHDLVSDPPQRCIRRSRPPPFEPRRATGARRRAIARRIFRFNNTSCHRAELLAVLPELLRNGIVLGRRGGPGDSPVVESTRRTPSPRRGSSRGRGASRRPFSGVPRDEPPTKSLAVAIKPPLFNAKPRVHVSRMEAVGRDSRSAIRRASSRVKRMLASFESL